MSNGPRAQGVVDSGGGAVGPDAVYEFSANDRAELAHWQRRTRETRRGRRGPWSVGRGGQVWCLEASPSWRAAEGCLRRVHDLDVEP